MMSIEEIIARLDGLSDPRDEAQLARMDEAVAALGESPRPEATPAMLRIFERFPQDDDGYETFWGILHVLEATPNYEPELARSVRRQPSEFGVLMINRMLNANIRDAGGANLVELLREAAAHERVPETVARLAAEFAERHGG